MDLRQSFRAALADKEPGDHSEGPGIDAPWFWDLQKRGYNDAFPGLRIRKVEIDAYNTSCSLLERRSLKYYSVISNMPSVSEDANIHACAHLYASDRNSLFVISNHVGVGDNYSHMASLAQTVIFHTIDTIMDTVDRSSGSSRWFC